MQRKPNVTLHSIKRLAELRATNKTIIRNGSQFLTKQQVKTSKKLP